MRIYQHIAWPTAVVAAVPLMRRTTGNDNNALVSMAGLNTAIQTKPPIDRLGEALVAMDRAIEQLEEAMDKQQAHKNI